MKTTGGKKHLAKKYLKRGATRWEASHMQAFIAEVYTAGDTNSNVHLVKNT